MLNRNIIKLFILSFALLFPALSQAADKQNKSIVFDIKTGVNLSHWLSQSHSRGNARRHFITQKDIQKIANLGFDHIRLPIDEVQLNNKDGSKQVETIKLMHDAIKWALAENLKVIVDLHIARSHYFLANKNPLWDEPKEQQKFIELWRMLSAELKSYSVDKVAYEILNEAVAKRARDWNLLSAKVIKDIRKREPKRFIVLGSNRWQGPETFPRLKIPENDPYIILSFHFYAPQALTHHKASWTEFAEYQGKVVYPGQTVAREEYKQLSAKTINAMNWANGYFDKAKLERLMMPAIRVAKKAKLQLYCGEYGIYPKAPNESAMAWYDDMTALFKKHKIARSHWGYKGDFPIINSNGDAKMQLVNIIKQ